MPVTPRQEPAQHDDDTFVCDICGETRTVDSGIHEIDGQRHNDILCQYCYEESTTECDRCSDSYYHMDEDIFEILPSHTHLCFNCYEDGSEFRCDYCNRRFEEAYEADVHHTDGRTNECLECYGVRTGSRIEAALQSTDQGEIIKSTRRFGIELETLFENRNAVRNIEAKIGHRWPLEHDGSIRTSKMAIEGREFVSPIMQGKAGEEEIKEVCKHARDEGFFVNTSCGFHLHLEALEFKRDRTFDVMETNPNIGAHKVMYAYNDKRVGKSMVENIDELPYWTEMDGRRNRVEYKVITQPQENKFLVNKGTSFYKVRDLFFVYLAFDDVFRGMQPPSRRNNRFCRATNSLYSLEKIRELEDYSALERMWYKIDRRYKLETQIEEAESRKRDKDESRYTGFNLEPLMRYGTKTIELRYHSPTLNPEKILRWIDIHQTIFDKVATGQWDEQEINRILTDETHLARKAKAMCRAFRISKDTCEYMLERIHKFNKFNVSEDEMNDEEVEPSEVGIPLHRSHPITPLVRPGSLDVPQQIRTRQRTGVTPMYTRSNLEEAARIAMPQGISTLDIMNEYLRNVDISSEEEGSTNY